jgi:hypothetical protein
MNSVFFRIKLSLSVNKFGMPFFGSWQLAAGSWQQATGYCLIKIQQKDG